MTVELNTRGVSVSTALQNLDLSAREVFLLGVFLDLIGNGEMVAKSEDGSAIEGIELVEEVPAIPSDQAAGSATTLANTIASAQFWRLRQTVSIADSSPFNIVLSGTSATPGTANHTLNIYMSDVNAAVTWQVAAIASGLAGAEGKVIFVNTTGSARNCFPQNHATSGASVRYANNVVQGDLVLPANSGSRLTVYYEIITDGATGLIEITGIRKYSA